MFPISKTYDIRDGMAGKSDEADEPVVLETKLIYLPTSILTALKMDARRCKRSLVKQIEAILTAYLGYEDVNLVDMSGVRAAVQPHITANTGKNMNDKAANK